MMNITWFAIAAFALSATCAHAQTWRGTKTGRQLFEKRCALCHGKDGAKGAFGAFNLQASKLSPGEVASIIANGRGRMPAWSTKLSADEIRTIAAYVQFLRKD